MTLPYACEFILFHVHCSKTWLLRSDGARVVIEDETGSLGHDIEQRNSGATRAMLFGLPFGDSLLPYTRFIGELLLGIAQMIA